MGTLLQDIRVAIRILARNPGFTAVALVVLTLGIGANSAVFSVVNSVLLEPLPYKDSDRLMQLGREVPQGRSDAVSISQFLFWRANNRSFTRMATYDGRGGGTNLVEGDHPERIPSIRVSVEFFDVLQVSPQLGRSFTIEDGHDGAEPVVIISDGLWRRRFGADPSIIGRVLRLSGSDRTVIGVMARDFDFNTHAEMWMPLTTVFAPQDRSAVYYVVARLNDGSTAETAQSDMNSVGERLRAEYPDLMVERERIFVRAHLDQVVGRVRPALMILMGAVALVLLIACANVANLLLARATGRRKEIALRAALGAGRLRIVRQLLTESVLLAVSGGMLGLVAARWGLGALTAMEPEHLPRFDTIDVDGTVFAFTLVLAVVTVILFGLFPSFQACKIDLHQVLKEGTSRTSAGPRRGRARGILVVTEVALALVLLIGATLLIDSFVRITRLDPGYDYEHVLTMKMSFGGATELTTARFTDVTRQIAERLKATPGIETAATISTLPLQHGLMTFFNVEGNTEAEGANARGMAQWRMIASDYFKAMGIPLVRGRTFTETDTTDSQRVIIVNEALVRKYFPNEDPIGRGLQSGDPSTGAPPDRIVGVVGDVREVALDRPESPTVFSFSAQADDGTTAFLASVLPTCWVVRTTGDPLGHANTIRSAVLAVDPEQPISSVRSMEQVMSESMARRQFNTALLTIFASVALLLAVVGIYGIMSYSVAQRTHEMGIRMALGAARGETLRLVLGHGMKLAVIGVVIGVVGAFALTRLMLSMLYEISATDPKTFVLASLIILLTAAIACLGPALRATRVDPMVALRCE